MAKERLVFEAMQTSGSFLEGMSVADLILIPCCWGDHGGAVGVSEPIYQCVS